MSNVFESHVWNQTKPTRFVSAEIKAGPAPVGCSVVSAKGRCGQPGKQRVISCIHEHVTLPAEVCDTCTQIIESMACAACWESREPHVCKMHTVEAPVLFAFIGRAVVCFVGFGFVELRPGGRDADKGRSQAMMENSKRYGEQPLVPSRGSTAEAPHGDEAKTGFEEEGIWSRLSPPGSLPWDSPDADVIGDIRRFHDKPDD